MKLAQRLVAAVHVAKNDLDLKNPLCSGFSKADAQ